MDGQTQNTEQARFYFFLGTVAEVIKMFPIMKNLKDNGVPYRLVSSGQNSIYNNELLVVNQLGNPDLTVSSGPKKQTFVSLFIWFVITLFKGVISFQKKFGSHTLEERKKVVVYVHGDTLSTLVGTIVAKLNNLKVAHIEAGLRSFDYLNPFPEEITRVLVSKMADVSYCPNDWAMANLKKSGGIKINTQNNTSIESLDFALAQKGDVELLKKLGSKKYYIFLVHRNEHLVNKKLMTNLVDIVQEYSNLLNCVFLLHKPTELVLKNYDLYDKLQTNPNINIVGRMPYVDFMKTLYSSEFIITDGGSTQEEAYFLGKPCLVVRKCTERIEGLGENVVLSKHDPAIVKEFIGNYQHYKRERVEYEKSPSRIISESLLS